MITYKITTVDEWVNDPTGAVPLESLGQGELWSLYKAVATQLKDSGAHFEDLLDVVYSLEVTNA